nr:hypothetical protein [Tanacetum cinerariifolium]
NCITQSKSEIIIIYLIVSSLDEIEGDGVEIECDEGITVNCITQSKSEIIIIYLIVSSLDEIEGDGVEIECDEGITESFETAQERIASLGEALKLLNKECGDQLRSLVDPNLIDRSITLKLSQLR